MKLVYITFAVLLLAMSCGSTSQSGDVRGRLDTTLVRMLDLTGDGRPDTVTLHLESGSMKDPFTWVLSIRSNGSVIYSLDRHDDAQADSLFYSREYLSGCSSYAECKKKFYFRDILSSLEARFSLEMILDRSQNNTLFAVAGEYLYGHYGIQGRDADRILQAMEARLRSGKIVVIHVRLSPLIYLPPMMFVREVNGFVPIYQE